MIIKGKNGSTLQGGTVFQHGSRVEPFWLHFFSQCSRACREGMKIFWWTKITVPTNWLYNFKVWYLVVISSGSEGPEPRE